MNFVGRDEYVGRFKARLEHYNFFLYEGIAGIGKTALARRLAKETKAAGVKSSLYLQLGAGEGIASILARVEALVLGKTSFSSERQGDPFGRLVEILTSQRLVLVLDELHHLGRNEFPALVRALRAARGPFKVIGAIRGDPELSAMDIMLLHQERVGPLTADEVRRFAHLNKVGDEATALLVADAVRGGSLAQPLTLKYMLALCGAKLPPKELLDQHSARSVNAFKAVMSYAETQAQMAPAERAALSDALHGLIAIGQPIAKAVAASAFGPGITKLLSRGLIDEIDGDLHVHPLVAQYYTAQPSPQEQQPPLYEFATKQAVTLASHLKQRAIKRAEPLSLIRAGKLLAQAGQLEDAVTTLADGWDAVQSLGFLEAYLKILASIPLVGALGPRVALLSARARMRQGSATQVREEMERLAQSDDSWTRVRALASLIYIYNQQQEHEKVVASFEDLRKLTQSPELLLEGGSLAAAALLRLSQIAAAEKMARAMLAKIRGKDEELERQGDLHRLLSQVYAQMGQLSGAVDEATKAAAAFTRAGDLYHAATAYGFIGDMHREAGDFEAAQEAFKRFHELALKWGDRNLIQIAELTEAWVALDLGDMTSAQKRIMAVEKELSSTASRRLRRYLAAARALLEAGRGHHEAAVEMLPKVIEAWDASGQRSIASTLRAQLVRSLLACGRVDEASTIVDEVLATVDVKTQAPRAAAFLRESALIRLRRKESKQAMAELAQACKLFAQGGNRREEAHTLYRIAHAAFEEGDLGLAQNRAAEALQLSRKIKHPRVEALARELQGRIAIVEGNGKESVAAGREALAALRRLGDEIGTLHVTESVLLAQIVVGDLAGAIRLGPKLSEQADALQVRDLRVRTIALTGIALLRKERVDAASRCFREIPDGMVSAWTATLMWRLGEALATHAGDRQTVADRRQRWVAALKRMSESRQRISLAILEQLKVPPAGRLQLRTHDDLKLLSAEQAAWVLPEQYELFVEVPQQRVLAGGKLLAVADEAQKLFDELVTAAPEPLSAAALSQRLFGTAPEAPVDPRLKALVKELAKTLRAVKSLNVELKGDQVVLTPPKSHAFLVPVAAPTELSGEQKKILKLVRKLGSAPLAILEGQLKLQRAQLKREVDALVRGGLITPVREGRNQAFRLA